MRVSVSLPHEDLQVFLAEDGEWYTWILNDRGKAIYTSGPHNDSIEAWTSASKAIADHLAKERERWPMLRHNMWAITAPWDAAEEEEGK